jgi:hypothetical protein
MVEQGVLKKREVSAPAAETKKIKDAPAASNRKNNP